MNHVKKLFTYMIGSKLRIAITVGIAAIVVGGALLPLTKEKKI